MYMYNLKIIVNNNHTPGSQNFAIMINPILACLRKVESMTSGVQPSFSHLAFP